MSFDISKNLSKIGESMMQMGITYGISKESMRGGSCGGGSIWNMGMGMGGCFGGGYMMGAMGGGCYGMDMGMDPRMMMQAQMMGAEYGAMAAESDFAKIIEMTKTPDAENVKKDTDSKAGEQLENDLNAQKTHSFATQDWKDLNAKEERTSKEQAKLDKDYKTMITNLAKSFVAQLRDTDKGNVTEDEYVNYVFRQAGADNLTNEEAAKLEEEAVNQFRNMDLNESGTLDYKELGAYINVLDKDSDDKVDGELSEDNIKDVNKQLSKADNIEIKEKLEESYKTLFGNQGGYASPFFGGF